MADEACWVGIIVISTITACNKAKPKIDEWEKKLKDFKLILEGSEGIKDSKKNIMDLGSKEPKSTDELIEDNVNKFADNLDKMPNVLKEQLGIKNISSEDFKNAYNFGKNVNLEAVKKNIEICKGNIWWAKRIRNVVIGISGVIGLGLIYLSKNLD